MEKISSILPASPRMKVAELSASQPARPGAPLMGRPEGKNSMGDRITLSKELERMRESGDLPGLEPAPTYKNTAENSKMKTIEDLNKKFFQNPKDIARDNGGLTRSEEVLKSVEDSESVERGEPKVVAPRVQSETPGLQASIVDKPL
ncbi:hypothetical protein [Bdellovibrio svalbardensis]|uniref:Uncharacterized protein n=1 Tax=Bdellovibrio svalbardensis TaxID=2972972 RepID=A0ABT6DGR7_9BACT|nr:hypothetical protein [Bdellovibrio svalbardensis]MDG0815450.1 hypothetical protein [Bdellovibrio svalbardensis]